MLTLLVTIPTAAIAIYEKMTAVPENVILAFNYGSSEILIYGADGESEKFPVVIRGVRSSEAGVKAQYHWIAARYPGYKPVFQAVHVSTGTSMDRSRKEWVYDPRSLKISELSLKEASPPKVFDTVVIRNWLRISKTLYFDITPFLPYPDSKDRFEQYEGVTIREVIAGDNSRLECGAKQFSITPFYSEENDQAFGACLGTLGLDSKMIVEFMSEHFGIDDFVPNYPIPGNSQ